MIAGKVGEGESLGCTLKVESIGFPVGWMRGTKKRVKSSLHMCGRSISMSPLTSGGKTIHLVLAFWGLRSFGYPSRQLQLGGWHSRERWVSEIEILSHL